MIKGIHLTDNEDEIEGRTDKVKGAWCCGPSF
jgi:uncharacterized Zn ribbon protein